MADAVDTAKISLPDFLKMLTSNNVPPSKAMMVAGKMRTHNTPEQLGSISEFSLESAGVTEKDLRKLVLVAVRKEGYKQKPSAVASSSRSVPSTSKAARKPQAKKKRKRDDDLNELLPDKPPQEGDSYGSLDFHEVLDEEAIKPKYTVVNRAPIMMAWAFVVAERLGFQREEALSIASVYTEMNAISKGVSLGIYEPGTQKLKGADASRTGSQPYVELMGRRLTRCVYAHPVHLATPPNDLTAFPVTQTRIPLYQTASSQWRGLSSGSPVAPASAFSYITRALRQTAPHIVGALRLLAASYAPAELNEKGFFLYADFRPEADSWGQRGEVRCSKILSLVKACREDHGRGSDGNGSTSTADTSVAGIVKMEDSAFADGEQAGQAQGQVQEQPPAAKKFKLEASERDEFDAALDDEPFFDEFDLSTIP
ncbi:hypothetical protein L227DRAFT_619426 [Lentinus tigrinus ALCF2SS1-6]|uniref:Uncharacterized protein n=1 Tax=Lentinus tigrinus ALCF2SS1-6 TaxID=1328759 RepID=A0A5C2T5H1_9APHY|nr:hypothetical protein L227DRAFT_619426 [Lentinus tigrinus ALCF2SS1-6]